MATTHVELFHQMKSELLKDHEAAVGRAVDRQAWEKAMEEYYHMRDIVSSQEPTRTVYCIYVEKDLSEQKSRGLW